MSTFKEAAINNLGGKRESTSQGTAVTPGQRRGGSGGGRRLVSGTVLKVLLTGPANRVCGRKEDSNVLPSGRTGFAFVEATEITEDQVWAGVGMQALGLGPV